MAFDLETTNLDKGSPLNPDNRIVLTAWKMRGEPVQHYAGNILECKQFWQDLEAADYLVAHNIKFEAGWLLRLGYDPTDKLWADTLLAEYVRLGNRKAPLDLGSVSERYGYKGKEELIDTMMKAGICPSDMPEKRLANRCRRDVITTAQVWEKQRRGLDKSNRLGILYTRSMLAPILAVIEGNGVCLDRERVRETYEEYATKLAEVRAKVDKFTGGINPNSPPQMARFLYEELKFPERTRANGKPIRNKPTKQFPDGAPMTDADTLEWLDTQAKTKRQKEWIKLRQEYGKLNAAVTKNLEFFKGVVEERENCIFYGKFNQSVAGTHRLSSSGRPQKFELFPKPKSVQFQNMPRVFKRLFRSRDPDYFFTEADAAQLEFRVAVDLTGDPQGHKDIRDPKFDAHVQSAAVIFDKDYAELFEAAKVKGEKWAKLLRQDAKPDTFKPLYGGTKGTPEQERYYHYFQHERYPAMYAVQEGWLNQVLSDGKLVTPWGMRFYWKFKVDKRGTAMYGGKPIGPKVFNYPVQSFATAEIVPIAIIHLFYRCKKDGLRVIFNNTVHDSVLAEVHKEDFDRYKEHVIEAFTTDVYKYLERVYRYKFSIPLGCEIVYGEFWSEGEEFGIDVEPRSD